MDNKYNTSMDYKRWDQEFVEIRESLKKISALSVEAKKKMGSMIEYFYEVEALFNINSSYVMNKNKIKKEIDILFDKVTSKKYQEGLTRLNPNSKILLKEYELKICRRIDNVFRAMSESFVESELRPKLTKEIKEAWETETDEDKRDELLALSQIGMNIK